MRQGKDIALIATGTQTIRALDAAAMLEQENIAASVLHLPTIKPLDENAIVTAAQSVRCVLTCEEHSIYGGLGGAIAEVLGQRHPIRIRRLGLRDVDGESGSERRADRRSTA